MINALIRFLAASFILIILLIVTPFFIPLDRYKPEVESQLSRAMGRNVVISSLRLQFLPAPALTARGIGVFGAGETSGEMFVNRLDITPVFDKLLDKELVIRRIHLKGVATNQAFLQTYLAQLRSPTTKEPSYVSIDEISASAITMRLPDDKILGPYEFKVFFDTGHQLSWLHIASSDDSIYMNVSPREAGYQIYLNASDWTPPVKTPLHFAKLVAKGQLENNNKQISNLNIEAYGGTLQNPITLSFDKLVASGQFEQNQIQLSNINVNAYGGTLQGPLTLTWGPQWNIAGQLDAKSIAIEPFLKALKGKGLTGSFDADLAFDLKAPEFRKLLVNPYVDGEFKIINGAISKSDSNTPVLVFDEFSGHGTLKDSQLMTHNAVMKTYGGTFAGNSAISWRQGWQATAQLEAESIAIKPLLDLLGGKGIAGNFNSKATVKLAAPTFKQLLAKPYIDGEFRITDGVITGKDPAQPMFSFDEFSGHGTLDSKQFSTRDATLKAYGGSFKGDSQISWAQDWTVSSQIEAENIDVRSLLAGFSDKKIVSGTFAGKGNISLAGASFFELIDNPAIEGQFSLNEGVFYKADLEKASTTLSQSTNTGGQTSFKNLSGSATIKNGRTFLSNLDLVSAALEANGAINIDNKKNIAGGMDVALRKTASLISIPVTISGTTEVLHIRPTKTAMLGGAVGTSILGPGIGTAIGIKVGKILNQIGTAITSDRGNSAAQTEIP